MARGKGIEQVYSIDEMHLVDPTPKLNIDGLQETACYEPNDGKAYWYFQCELPKRYRGGCTKCGSVNFYAHGQTEERLIHDVNVGMNQVDIAVKIPRDKCNDCGQTFLFPTDAIIPGSCVTTRLRDQIRYESFLMEFSAVAALHRISDSTVENIFDEYAEILEEARQREGVIAPRVCGIDEKHIQHKMRGIIANIENGEPLEFLDDNKKETIVNAIMSFDGWEKIRVVTMDMSNSYHGTIQTILPNARIVIDHYHVIQDLMKKTRTIKGRIQEQERAKLNTDNSQEKKLLDKLAKNSYLFKFGKDTLREKPERVALMAEVCKTFPDFNTLRILKEAFESIYDYDTREEAEKAYSDWREMVKKADKTVFAEYHSLMHSMDYWKPYVMNFFEPGCRFTNATTEGLNSLIERINIKGSGYSFKRLRAKLLLSPYVTQSKNYIKGKVKVTKQERVHNVSFSTGCNNNGNQFTYRTVVVDCPAIIEASTDAKESAFDYPNFFELQRIPLYNELGEVTQEEVEEYLDSLVLEENNAI